MIEVRKLRKVFPRAVEAVNGIDFDVTAGEVFGLLGPNGAGKSTTVGMLTTTTRRRAARPGSAASTSRRNLCSPGPSAASWFLAGSLFPITALPGGLTWIAKFLPLTHGLALMRYGLLGDDSGLHNIWRIGSTSGAAALSRVVPAAFAVVLTAVSIQAFTRSAVH